MRRYGFGAREITIKPRGSEETMTFESMTKLGYFFETGSVTLHNFLKGRSKFNELYEVVSYDGKPVDACVNETKIKRGRKTTVFKYIKIQNMWNGEEKEFTRAKDLLEYLHISQPTLPRFLDGTAKCCEMFKILEIQK